MDYKQQINDWFTTFEHRFEVRVPSIIARTATDFYKERFQTQEWDKIPWPALNETYAASKTRGKGQILTASGALQRSIRPTLVSEKKIVISGGSAIAPYAKIHNEGLRTRKVVYVKPFTHTNFKGKGKRVQIRKHTRKMDYTMPQRQFMGYSPYLNQILRERLINSFKER